MIDITITALSGCVIHSLFIKCNYAKLTVANIVLHEFLVFLILRVLLYILNPSVL